MERTDPHRSQAVLWRRRNLSVPQQVRNLSVRTGTPVRLDQYLADALSWRSRSRLKRLVVQGFVEVNGTAAKPSRKVRDGDVVTLHLSMGTDVPEPNEEVSLDIIYEDPWLVAVAKPPDLLVHPVGRHVYGTLINHLHRRYRGDSDERPHGRDHVTTIPRLCHRLDRDTTGVVLVAKESSVHRDVMGQFANRRVRKLYAALVPGDFPHSSIRLTNPMGEGRCLASCLEHEVLREARTDVTVEERFGHHTLLTCEPKTGRQNQIRVHLAAAGFPIVGDERYGEAPPPAGFPPRFLLHSRLLAFYHPKLKSRVELAAALPGDFSDVLSSFRAESTTACH
jgi:23S rRNA pseudouridine1911/1915/1917 synthase